MNHTQLRSFRAVAAEGGLTAASRVLNVGQPTITSQVKALGGLIAAGLDGVARELDPGRATLIDPANFDAEEQAARGIERYPTTLDAALTALERDEVLMDALGPELGRSYLTVKRSEYEAFAAEDLDFEIKHHIHKF